MPSISRRAVVQGMAGLAAVGLLAACSHDDPMATPTGADDPDLQRRTRIATAEAALIALYDAAIAAHPGLAGRLRAFRADHAAHLAAVNVGNSIAIPAQKAPAIPATESATIGALAAAEASASKARGADAVAVARWQFARELSLIGASEAAHHSLLAT